MRGCLRGRCLSTLKAQTLLSLSVTCVRLFLFSDPPIYKLLTGDLYHWVMYEYHYLLTMVGMTAQGLYTTNNAVVSTNKIAATQPSYYD